MVLVENWEFPDRSFLILRMSVFDGTTIPVDVKDIDSRLRDRGVFECCYMSAMLFV